MSIIKVENLSKKYIIGHDRGAQGAFQYYSLRDSLAHFGRGMYQRLRHPLSPNQEHTELEEFWALKDINFEIKQGDRVGIIGRNGAGKSTLLKILSRITEPTSGKITMRGRVASLLEVGTGFHPELTGRENIYLNGAILGMTRVEIKKKFDEIVAFAEVEKFLDTPVKRYSSGMYVRLAFAVAAHLEPEILLVDEVLAVGDAEFQKKCLGKMKDVSEEGRTIIFVSHNMTAIQQLCNIGIFLKSGTIKLIDNAKDACKNYIGKYQENITVMSFPNDLSKEICCTQIQLKNKNTITLNDDIHILISYVVNQIQKGIQIVVHLWTHDDIHLFSSADIDFSRDVANKRLKGNHTDKIIIPRGIFAPGKYKITLAIGIPNLHLIENKDGVVFEITENDSYAVNWSEARKDCLLALPVQWK